MSVNKLLRRIVEVPMGKAAVIDDKASSYGITSDPLIHFAVLLAALVHDVDHRGVSNDVLLNEDPELAAAYKGLSIAEQNSVDLAWKGLMSEGFENLRSAIYTTQDDLQRFRQLIVNSVMATDIFDNELKQLRTKRWEKAFSSSGQTDHNSDINSNTDRKATIVIEHLLRASDVYVSLYHSTLPTGCRRMDRSESSFNCARASFLLSYC